MAPPELSTEDRSPPTAAGCIISDTSQDALGLLVHLGMLLAHVQPAVSEYMQDCLPHREDSTAEGQKVMEPLLPNDAPGYCSVKP